MTSLLQAGSGFVMEPTYQRIIIDCLDDPDETLKRKVNMEFVITTGTQAQGMRKQANLIYFFVRLGHLWLGTL